MIFKETALRGAYVVELDPHRDDRGFFARAFCVDEFERHGLNTAVVQANLSFNHEAGTVRGMHYQVAPATETKFIRCVRGAILDVIVDLRPDSPTYLEHIAVELDQENRRALFVPALFGHGYQTLAADSEVLYQVSAFYAPEYERGARYDDPAFGIEWPRPVSVISDKDLAWDAYQAEGNAS
jgi:dTDP-4-dehydrorhamnose 3,5-epimerase